MVCLLLFFPGHGDCVDLYVSVAMVIAFVALCFHDHDVDSDLRVCVRGLGNPFGLGDRVILCVLVAVVIVFFLCVEAMVTALFCVFQWPCWSRCFACFSGYGNRVALCVL